MTQPAPTDEDIVRYYKDSRPPSIADTAAHFGLSHQKTRRVLLAAGAYTTPTSRRVMELHEAGLSPQQIATELSIGIKAVFVYLPYSKGQYKTDSPTDNALRIRRHRAKRNEEGG